MFVKKSHWLVPIAQRLGFWVTPVRLSSLYGEFVRITWRAPKS
jgi:hypothetical protein